MVNITIMSPNDYIYTDRPLTLTSQGLGEVVLLTGVFTFSISLSRLIASTLILLAMAGIVLYVLRSSYSDIRAIGTVRKIGKLSYHESYGWGRSIVFDNLQAESPKFRKIGEGKPRLVYPHEEKPPFDTEDRIQMILSTASNDMHGRFLVIKKFEVLGNE